MKHLGLFEGIGGFSLAARWMGWETIAWCEWNEFGQKVLRHHFPEAEGHGDITKTDFTKYANRIDILTGGFPCQPYSQAGKRKGKEDERHLWPEMLRAIREVRPRWIVGENVLGLVNWSGGWVFHEVQTDMEAEGYEVFPYVLPACAKDAPHRRDRVWFVAYANGNGNRNIGEQDRKENGLQKFNREAIHTGESTGTDTGLIANSEGDGDRKRGIAYRGKNAGWEMRTIRANELSNVANGDAPDTCDKGLQGCEIDRSIRGIGENGNQQPARPFRTTWQDFPTQSPLCNGDDGLSSRLDLSSISFPKWRNESIKAGGNAIVPQVAFEIFKAVEQYERIAKK